MEKTIEEMKEEMYRMIMTPPGICWQCGKDFFTMGPRNCCSKCLGMGCEPFSRSGFMVIGAFCLLFSVVALWVLK
jgi:hypothetical protein